MQTEVDLSEKWNESYQELQRYHAEHGDCLVPQKFPPNPQLGRWVQTQRKQYKFMKDNKRSSMTLDRAQLLNELNFTWNTIDSKWMENFEKLQRFKTKYGTFEVPSDSEEFSKLKWWVRDQRKFYSLLKKGEPSRITPERVSLLDGLGFLWTGPTVAVAQRKSASESNNSDKKTQPSTYSEEKIKIELPSEIKQQSADTLSRRNDDFWNTRLEELRAYNDVHGDCNVSETCKQYPKLGIWVRNMKSQQARLKEGKSTYLTPERLRALEDINIAWNCDYQSEAYLKNQKKLQERRMKNNMRMKKWRSSVPDEVKEQHRAKNAKRKRETRANESAEAAVKRKKREALRMRLKRLNESEESAAKRKLIEAERRRERRAKEPEDLAKERREREARRRREKRAGEPEEVAKERREREAARRREQRAKVKAKELEEATLKHIAHGIERKLQVQASPRKHTTGVSMQQTANSLKYEESANGPEEIIPGGNTNESHTAGSLAPDVNVQEIAVDQAYQSEVVGFMRGDDPSSIPQTYNFP
mmetsp:Transcript_9436/g.13851  ORF Transcript_9436/g.13851 Transcript_9436/m.13851 type:complete len:531 (-) Transcript_9436:88-1680(-)